MSLTIKGRPIRFSLKWLKPPPAPPDGSMTLFEHLRELRYRLVVASLAIIAATIVAAFFYQFLLELLTAPYRSGIDDLKENNPEAVTELVNINLTSPLKLAVQVCLVAGLVLSGPVWLYQLWAFIVPGLLAKEKKWALIFIGAASPLFAAGVATAYYVLPKAIAVLLSFTAEGVANLQDINLFLSFMLRLMVVFGIAYLIPLLVLMLNIVGVVTASQLTKYRTLVIFGTFVFGAVATPSTDPFSMLALALPMTLLFLATEALAHLLDRRKAKRIGAIGDELLASDKALRELSADGPPSTNGHAPERSQTMLEPSSEDLRDEDEPPRAR
ncbi:MAG TPA: twin-arginine translocase subunit TatC [Propionibacteriaceae bacterium]|nr:twin-arginine translocase subunit TatC [Propionibacteriaceae bacterium]